MPNMPINSSTLEESLRPIKHHEPILSCTYTSGGNRVLALMPKDKPTFRFIVRGNELIPAQIIDGKVSMVIR